MSDAMQISRSGMDVEWQRLRVIAQNLANLGTGRTADGGTYRPQRLVSGPDRAFADMLAGTGGAPTGVRVVWVDPSRWASGGCTIRPIRRRTRRASSAYPRSTMSAR
ncbi:flagellar basal body rod protein FlgC [Sphingomonas sp. MMS24-JH45]